MPSALCFQRGLRSFLGGDIRVGGRCPIFKSGDCARHPTLLPVHSVAFSSDGARIASASRDETVKLWDVATGHLIRTFEGHTSYVNAGRLLP